MTEASASVGLLLATALVGVIFFLLFSVYRTRKLKDTFRLPNLRLRYVYENFFSII